MVRGLDAEFDPTQSSLSSSSSSPSTSSPSTASTISPSTSPSSLYPLASYEEEEWGDVGNEYTEDIHEYNDQDEKKYQHSCQDNDNHNDDQHDHYVHVDISNCSSSSSPDDHKSSSSSPSLSSDPHKPFVRQIQNSKWSAKLSDEHSIHIFSFFSPHVFSSIIAHVCKEFSQIILRDPNEYLYKLSCLKIFSMDTAEKFHKYYLRHQLSYFHMLRYREHVRLDGAYICKTSYHKQHEVRERRGVGDIILPILVTYYRYLLFYPHGRVEYALLHSNPPSFDVPIKLNDKHIRVGKYQLWRNQIVVKIDLGHMKAIMKFVIEKENENFNQLTMVEYRGKSDRDRQEIDFPLPDSYFMFRIHK